MADLSKIQPSDIYIAYTLECSQCGDPKEANGAASTVIAAADFNTDGWKAVEGEITCPDCQDGEEQQP